MLSYVCKNFWPTTVRKFARIWMKFWSLWFEVQVHLVTVFGYIALLLLLVSIILIFLQLWSTTWFLWCSYLFYIQYIWLFTILLDKLTIYEVIYFHFRFWFPFLQSKTLVGGKWCHGGSLNSRNFSLE